MTGDESALRVSRVKLLYIGVTVYAILGLPLGLLVAASGDYLLALGIYVATAVLLLLVVLHWNIIDIVNHGEWPL